METTTERTLDGVPITHGLRVWDYDLRAGYIDLSGCRPHHWEPSAMYPGKRTLWFYVVHDDGKRSLMNAERCWVKHPFDKISA